MWRGGRSLLLLWLVACSGALPNPAHPRPVEPRYEDARGRPLTFEEVVERLRGARVVYLGERHDRADDHALQDRLHEALRPRALGLEMFQAMAQPALDAWIAGEIDEETMLERAEWESRWGFDYAFYRPMLRRARDDGGRALALNAPAELTRAIAREGLEGLDEERRALLPEVDLEVEAHRARFVQAMRGHPAMTPARVERFYAAQVVWDETMAARVAEHVADPAALALIVLAGTMHVWRDAIPERAARRTAHEFAVVFPVDEEDLARGRPDADVLAVFPAR